MKFEPLIIGKASEYIERKIKEAVLDEKLKPGNKLPSEREMAEQFNVSVGSVREALKGLQILGLIEKKKGRAGGIFISEISNQAAKKSLGQFLTFNKLSIKHVYEARKIIEPHLVKIAIDNITPDFINKLEDNVLSIEKKSKKIGLKITKKDYVDIDKINLEFHKIIVEMTNNPILIFISCYIYDLLAALDEKRGEHDFKFVNETICDHRRLLDFIKQGDVRKGEEAVVSHLNKLSEVLVEFEKKFLIETT